MRKADPPRFPRRPSASDEVHFAGVFSATYGEKNGAFWLIQVWLWESGGEWWGQYLRDHYTRGAEREFISTEKIVPACSEQCKVLSLRDEPRRREPHSRVHRRAHDDGREPTRTGDADARGDAAGILPRSGAAHHEGGKPSMARSRDQRRNDQLENPAGPSDRGDKAAASLMRSCVLSFIAFLLMAAPAAAQPCPALHVRNPDGNYIVPGVKGNIAYSGDLALDAYVQQGSPRRPSVVVIHGGMWSAGSRIAHVGQILEVLTRAGYNWFSLDYRLGGLARFEDSLADVRAALAFIRCRSAELGIDANQLVLLGEDSGAQLAALLAAERPAGVIGAVLIGGFYDLAAIPSLSRDIDRDVLARASPITSAVSRMPPLLVVHGEADGEAPAEQARRYCSQVSNPLGPAEAGRHARVLTQASNPLGPAEAGRHARVLTQASNPLGPAEAGRHARVLTQVSKPLGPAEAGRHARVLTQVSKPLGPAEAGGHARVVTQVSKPLGPAEAGGHARVLTQVGQGRGRCQFVGVTGGSHRSENWFPSQWGYKRAMVEWLSALAAVDVGSRTGRAAASWSRTSSIVRPRSSGSTRTFRARASRSPRSSSSMVAAGKPATR